VGEALIGRSAISCASPFTGGVKVDSTVLSALNEEVVRRRMIGGDAATDAFTRQQLGGELRTDKETFLCLEGADLSGNDLSGIDLRFGILRDVNLANTDLSNSDLGREIVLENANLRGANLTGVHMESPVLTGADLTNATLREATVSGLSKVMLKEPDNSNLVINNTDFAGAMLRFFRFHSSITDSNFTQANLYSANFLRQQLDNVDFTGASLHGAIYTRASIRNVKFVNADLADALFLDSTLSSVDFTGAYLVGANFSGATLEQVTCPDGTSHTASDGDNMTCANNLLDNWQPGVPERKWVIDTLTEYLETVTTQSLRSWATVVWDDFLSDILKGQVTRDDWLDNETRFANSTGGSANFNIAGMSAVLDPPNIPVAGRYVQVLLECSYANYDQCQQRVTLHLEDDAYKVVSHERSVGSSNGAQAN
jgi:uncharacterized protein YjbI with pentapeptide repeats